MTDLVIELQPYSLSLNSYSPSSGLFGTYQIIRVSSLVCGVYVCGVCVCVLCVCYVCYVCVCM